MPNTSPNLALPYLLPSQAQKHVTHNEALARLDQIVQLVVQGFGGLIPPTSPGAGEIHALGAAPEGAWTGQGGRLAAWDGTAWAFLPPRDGWRAWGRTEGELRIWRGTAWERLPLDNLAGLGVNTTHDATNRLAVAAAATLLTHAGAGHQVKINKAAAGQTASLLLQDNWSGRAEIGLAGSDDLVVKVSADGAVWTEALKVLAAGGAASVLAGFQIGGQTAYHRGNLLGAVSQSAGIPSGGVIERGSNANGEYVRFADGTQICTRSAATFTYGDANHLSFSWTFPAAFATGTLPIRQVAYSNTDSDLTGITMQALGALRLGAGVVSSATRIARAQGAANFTSGNQIANCTLTALGRWF